jgi:hypothetical protein
LRDKRETPWFYCNDAGVLALGLGFDRIVLAEHDCLRQRAGNFFAGNFSFDN